MISTSRCSACQSTSSDLYRRVQTCALKRLRRLCELGDLAYGACAGTPIDDRKNNLPNAVFDVLGDKNLGIGRGTP